MLLYRDVTQERQAERAKSEFMSLASHQLRTPLTAIRWSLNRLAKSVSGKVSGAELALFHQSHGAAIRMAATIDTMLEISRIEAGHVQLRLTELPLERFLNSLLGRFRLQADTNYKVLRCDCPADLRLRTDCNLLEQMLDNLVSNAVKYTPKGGEVVVSAVPMGDTLRIAVQDTGYGIPLDQQQHIFRKFFRGDNIVRRDTEGTGLGLYLTALIAPLLGGSIEFVSEEGKGSVFVVELPISSQGQCKTPPPRER